MNMKNTVKRMEILLISCLIFLVGCGKSDEKKLAGTWYEIRAYDGAVNYDEAITFFEDGTFYGFDEDGTYSISDGKLAVHIQWAISDFDFLFRYQFDGDTLILTDEDGDEYRYLKEK